MDIRKRILADIAADSMLSVRGIRLDLGRKRFLQDRRVLLVHGTVTNGAQKDRLLKLAQEAAGSAYEIMDHLFVSELLWEG